MGDHNLGELLDDMGWALAQNSGQRQYADFPSYVYSILTLYIVGLNLWVKRKNIKITWQYQ